MTIHAYKRNHYYRHSDIPHVESIRFSSPAGAEQKYTGRIRLDFIFTIEINQLFCPPKNYVVIANESFAAVVNLKEFKVALRECRSQVFWQAINGRKLSWTIELSFC
ncbi:protein of unknown function [Stenotrophomonas maltophilia]|nr:protein of unknown function [Stenotrophomonas maltophilia]